MWCILGQMSGMYIGTSGFSYKDWIGPFYPEGLRKEEFLPYYAERFSFVELNFPYYRIPSPYTLEKMLEKTPDDFLFSLKAHKSMTHERADGWEGETERYIEGIKPVMEAGRLSGVLLQFPYSFHYTKENRSYLARLCDYLTRSSPASHSSDSPPSSNSSMPLLVEFRNAEWSTASVREELQARNITFVVTDSPDLYNLPSPESIVTTEVAYFRFHGRNKTDWWTGDNTSRYDYRYSYEELGELLPILKTMAQESTRLYIAFNNHHKGQATSNACMLKELFSEERE